LNTVLGVCRAAGVETELYQAGGRTVKGCVACGGCSKTKGRCSQNDWLNELYPKMKGADAIVLGSPTYFADMTPELKCIIDRAGMVGMNDDGAFSRKIGASAVAVRRGGGVCVCDGIQHFFLISDMVVPGSYYWNISQCLHPGEYEKDEEGVETMTRLGENIVWLLNKLNA
jgi:multimeric flavodoxin WrbA